MKALLLMLMTLTIVANENLAPPSFQLGRSDRQVVFTDILKAKYEITYDFNSRKALAKSTLQIKLKEEGYPVIDLVPEATMVQVGKTVSELIDHRVESVTNLRYLNHVLPAGIHEIVIENEITRGTTFEKGMLKSAFFMSDLTDRRYLEQYLPANFEYDQYPSKFIVKFVGEAKEHTVYTNGQSRRIGADHFEIDFPAHFTASSYYFHVVAKGRFNEHKEVFTSIDGRKIPLTFYSSSSLKPFITRTRSVLAELEKDYGPWPHQSVVVYGAGRGGMEYCGATRTSLSALGHELIHSYFARGVMPARGNSGWIDEAIASWRDSGYRQRNERSLYRANMGAHSIYRRTTDRQAYSKGRDFLGFLDLKLAEKGGLKKFLKRFRDDRLFKPMLNENFIGDMEMFFNTSVSEHFDKYIFGKSGIEQDKHEHEVENPMHPKLSEKELQDLI